ncbi:isochorismatase family protein [Bradyrhizobium sp. SZCCHNS2005]|uniref:isochorismatase family protein n=1 Tax=Bradyrhizobium sp. SZCCHNS2005 TaxID=3057303 RepID=UPI0028EDB372|nr:isochorismatase family protein [Bradyrhizobium sp. SZCCHNS2005]
MVGTSMLADPRYSQVVLINLGRGKGSALDDLAALYPGLCWLQAGYELFGVEPVIVCDDGPSTAEAIARSVGSRTQLVCDALSVWGESRFTDMLASSDCRILFLGGSWLEEEIFIVALQAAERGYDVRLLSDCVQTRREADRSLAFDRLAIHGVLVATTRQMLLEWAVSVGDPILKQEVQQRLS